MEHTGTTWILVGSVDGKPKLWTSADAQSWREEAIPGLGSSGGHLASVTAINDVFVVVGWLSDRGGDRPIAVAGQPGLWSVLDNIPLPPLVGGRLNAAAAGNGIVLVAGGLANGAPAAWTTSDAGVTWSEPILLPAERGSSVAGIALADGEFVAVGEVIGNPTGPGAWRSSDGETWELEVIGTGSTAGIFASSAGPVAVGHDGNGGAALWSLEAAARALQPPGAGELLAGAAAGELVVVTTAAPAPAAMWAHVAGSWIGIDIGQTGGLVLRSLRVWGDAVVAAGDDGARITVLTVGLGDLAP